MGSDAWRAFAAAVHCMVACLRLLPAVGSWRRVKACPAGVGSLMLGLTPAVTAATPVLLVLILLSALADDMQRA